MKTIEGKDYNKIIYNYKKYLIRCENEGVNPVGFVHWKSIVIDYKESLQKENEELLSKQQNAAYWAENERKGRERMRKLYAQKINEKTQLKERIKELEELEKKNILKFQWFIQSRIMEKIKELREHGAHADFCDWFNNVRNEFLTNKNQ